MSEYAKSYYGVPADIGRRVEVNGRAGIIAEDGGNYIAVNFDGDKPGVITPAHPTWRVEYLGMGKPRQLTRSQQRYQHYLKVADCFDSFRHYLLVIHGGSQQESDGIEVASRDGTTHWQRVLGRSTKEQADG